MDIETSERRTDEPVENEYTFDPDQTWRITDGDPDATWPTRRPTRERPIDEAG